MPVKLQLRILTMKTLKECPVQAYGRSGCK